MALRSLFILVTIIHLVYSHGYMEVPPNRASMWRYGYDTPVNYNDNEYFCGGFDNQYNVNGGKCGECGDDYRMRRPRTNEFFGNYSHRIITRQYHVGQVVEVTVVITANHLGWFQFSICPLTKKRPFETESCFDEHILELNDMEGTKWPVPESDLGTFTIRVKLPPGLTCSRCVMRWHYNAGNTWGTCEDGTGAMGCGNQETFRSCADIAIVGGKSMNEKTILQNEFDLSNVNEEMN